MSNLSSFTPERMIKILENKGFILKRVKGSHHIYHNPETKKRTIIPLHKKDLPKGTFFTILKQAGIDKTELQEH